MMGEKYKEEVGWLIATTTLVIKADTVHLLDTVHY